MTRQIGYEPTTDQRLAGTRRDVERLKRRVQLPDGGSPIPFAILRASDTLSAGPTGSKFWWDLLPPNGTDFTNAPAIFSNPTHTITAGAGNVNSGSFHGLSIDQPGVYKAKKMIQILSLFNDTTLRAITIYQHFDALSSTDDGVFGDQNHVNQGHGFNEERWDVDTGDAPTGATLLASVNGEASSYTCIVSLWVEQVSSTPMSFI